jgi:hypothetical protein
VKCCFVCSIVKLARKHGGEDAAKMFLTDEFLNNEEKFNLMVRSNLTRGLVNVGAIIFNPPR